MRRWLRKVEYVNDPKCIDTINSLNVAMVVNDMGRAETEIVAGNSMEVLHGSVTNHKSNQIFLEEWTIATNFRSEYSPHRANFRPKFRVALTTSRNMSPKVRAVQNNTCLVHENIIFLQSTSCRLITEYFDENSSVNIGG